MGQAPVGIILRPRIRDVAARFVIIALRIVVAGPDDLDNINNTCTLLARFARPLCSPLCLDIFSSGRDLLKAPGVVRAWSLAARRASAIAPVSRTMLALARFSRPHPIIADTTRHAHTDMALQTDVALRSQLRHSLLDRTYNTRAR